MARKKDPALAALDGVVAAVARAESDLAAVRARAEHIQLERAQGVAWRDLVQAEAQPLIVKILADLQESLGAAGAAWRKAEAQALHAEGLSMDAIAALFGVTRQRVSALLRDG